MRRVGYPTLEKSGRLGNQLYEIASTVGLARARGVDPVFPESWSYRPYFCCPDEWFDDAALAKASDAVKLCRLPGIQKFYMQSWKLVAPVLDEVRRVFAPSPLAVDLLAEHLEATGQVALPFSTAVSLHCRRGDNTNPDTHPLGTWPTVTLDYYRDALDNIGEGPVLVFSEDPDWCRDNLGPVLLDAGRWDSFFVAPGPVRPPDYFPDQYAAAPPTDFIDLQLMAACRAHINANSTYSLWAAVIGGGRTTYPDNWVGFRCRDALPPEHTICPPDWTMIHNPVPQEELVP